MREEITVTAQLIYDCPRDAALTEQSDMIHGDLTRLLDADSTTGVACCGVTIQHIAPEAETYGTTEAATWPNARVTGSRSPCRQSMPTPTTRGLC